MALSKAELKALIKTSLGPLGEKINERREAAEEAAAAATAKTAETDQTAAAEFGRLCRDVAVSRRSFSDDGELTATADPQGALRTPGMSPSGKTMALVLRGLAAAFAQKARQGEAHDVAAEFIAEHYADSSRAEPAIKSLMTGKTLVTTNQAGAGVLVAGPAKAAMVELLRPQAVLTALGARDINLPPGGLTMPVQATSGSGVWLGETEAVPASQPSFSSKTMKGYKYASLVLVSEELMAGADLNVEQFIMDDLRLDAGTAIDIAFLRGNDNVRPRGVRHLGIPTATTGTTDAQVDAIVVYARKISAGETVLRKVSSLAQSGGANSTLVVTSTTWTTADEIPTDHTLPPPPRLLGILELRRKGNPRRRPASSSARNT